MKSENKVVAIITLAAVSCVVGVAFFNADEPILALWYLVIALVGSAYGLIESARFSDEL